jgi:HEAT repeat protein
MAVPALQEGLRDPHLAPFRPSYALALLLIDRPAAKAAVPALMEILDHKSHALYLPDELGSAVRKQAARALGLMREEACEAIPALAHTLGDAEAGVRYEAVKALGEIGVQARAAVPSLQKCLTDPDKAVRSEADLALKKIGA